MKHSVYKQICLGKSDVTLVSLNTFLIRWSQVMKDSSKFSEKSVFNAKFLNVVSIPQFAVVILIKNMTPFLCQ